MTKDSLILVGHVLECIKLIESYLKRFKNHDFFQEEWLQDMMVRRVEIIGEAVRNISPALKKKYPDVAWHDIVGTRNILVHVYDAVDLDIIWKIIKHKLPTLKKQMIQIKKDLEKNQ